MFKTRALAGEPDTSFGGIGTSLNKICDTFICLSRSINETASNDYRKNKNLTTITGFEEVPGGTSDIKDANVVIIDMSDNPFDSDLVEALSSIDMSDV